MNSAFVTEEGQEGHRGLEMAIANSTGVEFKDKSPGKSAQVVDG